jgi:hypothetical protein
MLAGLGRTNQTIFPVGASFVCPSIKMRIREVFVRFVVADDEKAARIVAVYLLTVSIV